ncbi:MAG: hypothetical protein A2W31_06530 [Planctomycetes bacterium RBG_16_64_10]|nr:MAG: hypothetical protein A2W31_06530 [Planctomycetes bacterium RBG_16_64_10]
MPIETESIRQQGSGVLRGSIAALLVQRWLGPGAALGALLLTLPALGVGWVADDHYQRWVLRQSPVYAGLRPPPADMFRFVDGNPRRTERMKEIGLVPWWTSPTMRVAFWRPLTVLTHVVDQKLWPGRPAIMHAHNLCWFGLLLLSVALLYRQILGRTVAAGLAIVLYAVDYTHAVPAAWLANRSTLLAALFGVLAIYAHDQWRRCGRRLAAVLGPLLLAMALLSAEAGIATVAYVLAYALTLDRSTWQSKAATILPYVLVVFLWRTLWSWQGYGVAEFDYVYLDPAAHPFRFCGMVFLRAPILLLSQLAMPPAEAHVVLGPHGALWVCLAGLAVLLLLVFLLWSLLRSTAAARFWAIGMVLATIPCCATIPLTRHLMFISIGAMGLLGQYLAMALGGGRWPNVSLLRRLVEGMLVGLLLLVHLLLAPLGLLLLSRYPVGPSQFLASLHAIPCTTALHGSQDLIIVNHPLPGVVLSC